MSKKITPPVLNPLSAATLLSILLCYSAPGLAARFDLGNGVEGLGGLPAARALVVHARAGVLLPGNLELGGSALRALGADLADAEFHARSLMNGVPRDEGTISRRRAK